MPPISFPGTSSPGTGYGNRSIGSVVLDDGISSYVQEVVIPSTREVQMERVINRHGRMTRVKEDDKPLVVDVRGFYRDGAAPGAYYRDFKAALLQQSRAAFTLGDGTRLEMVDVMELTQKMIAHSQAWTATPDCLYAWMLKAHSYEPYARAVSPTLQSLGTLNSGNGTISTSYSVQCLGSAYSEPTWQFQFTCPAGVTVTGLSLQNTTSGESCFLNTVFFPPGGPYYVLVDASGAVGGASPWASPNNNGYALLYGNSLGYGCTYFVSPSTSGTDLDFTGRIPSLIPSQVPQIPQSAFPNNIVATVTANGALTGASLSVLAPARFYR